MSLIRFNVMRLLSFFRLYVISVLSNDVNAITVIVLMLVLILLLLTCKPEIIQINLNLKLEIPRVLNNNN